MSLVRVPIFSGLVTNADPEDLNKSLTPETSNFDISTTGVLRRRDASKLIKTFEDRGITNSVLWANNKLDNGGYEWIVYCKQRGILYRIDPLWQNILLDSYDGLTSNFTSVNSPVDNSAIPYANYLKVMPDPLADNISFTLVGDYLSVNTNHENDPYIIHRTKDVEMFGGKVTVDNATYIEPYFRDYPGQFELLVSGGTDGGTLVNGVYQYNISPVYDGVNEYPLKGEINRDITLASANANANNQNATLIIKLNKNNFYRSLTGINIYRSYATDGNATPTSFRRTKRINLRGSSGLNDQVVSSSTIKGSQFIMYSQSGFPSKNDLITAYDDKYGSGSFNADDPYYAVFQLTTKENWEAVGSPDGSFVGGTKYVQPGTEIEYFYTGSTARYYSSYDGSVSTLWNNRVANGYENRFLDGDKRRFLSNEVTNNIANNSGVNALAWESNGSSVLLAVRSESNNRVCYVPVHGVYSGRDKLYSVDADIFSVHNTYSGNELEITNGNSTFEEVINIHDKRMIQVTTSGNPSSNMLSITGYAGVDENSEEAPVRTVSITTTGNLTYTENGNEIIISYTDRGDSIGSLPPVPMKSIIDLRWKHSIPHGGRLFVGNVMLDPKDSAETFTDMICFSEAGMPGVIPIVNFIQIKDPQGGQITGLQTIGDSLVVLMENGVYRLRVPSIDPKTFQILESHEQIGCIAEKSVVKVEDVIYFCGRGNIYRVDGSFMVSEIGDSILDKWLDEPNKEKTEVNYDPVKECVILRLGSTKRILYEYNIRSGLWNKIKTYGSVSSMAQGLNGSLFVFDNTHLNISRDDGSSIPEDPDAGDFDLGISLPEFNSTEDIIAEERQESIAFGSAYGREDESFLPPHINFQGAPFYALAQEDFVGGGWYNNSNYMFLELISDNVQLLDGSVLALCKLKVLSDSYINIVHSWHFANVHHEEEVDYNENLFFDVYPEIHVVFPKAQLQELTAHGDMTSYTTGDFETWEDPYGEVGTMKSRLICIRANTPETLPTIINSTELGTPFYIKFDDVTGIKRWTDMYITGGLVGENGDAGTETETTTSYETPSIALVNDTTAVTSDGTNIHLPYWGRIINPNASGFTSSLDPDQSGNAPEFAGVYQGAVDHQVSTHPIVIIRFQYWHLYSPDGNGGHTSGIWRPIKNSALTYNGSPKYLTFWRAGINTYNSQPIQGIVTQSQRNANMLIGDEYLAYNPFSADPVQLEKIDLPDPGNFLNVEYSTNFTPDKGLRQVEAF